MQDFQRLNQRVGARLDEGDSKLAILILIKTDDGAQRAIHPLVLDIILDEDNLSPRQRVSSASPGSV